MDLADLESISSARHRMQTMQNKNSQTEMLDIQLSGFVEEEIPQNVLLL